jgi:hypothetical protein
MNARSKNLRDQAQGLAQDLAEQVGPHLESAVETARETIAPRLVEARDQLAPHVADARERIRTEVIPTVQSALADARDQAVPLAEEARKRGAAAAAALKGEQPAKKRGKGRWIAVLALHGAAAVAAKRLLGGGGSGNHSGYTPPVPQQRTGPVSATGGDLGGDAGGATPEEALADATEAPHDVTTPADPAETVEVPRD